MKITVTGTATPAAAREHVRIVRDQRRATLAKLDARIDADYYGGKFRTRAKRIANRLEVHSTRYANVIAKLENETWGGL